MSVSASLRVIPIALIGLLSVNAVLAQRSHRDMGPVFVDQAGVMRWTTSREEVALFGVNYTTPFAHAYRAHGALGVDRRSAIDADVDHLARLGLDAFRVHVWEREVADSVGNLVANDHLDLYDYLVAKLAERGIRTILTPIAWWGNGYPERDIATGSFTDPWNKGQMNSEPEAIAAQVRYIGQFVRHVNPYTGHRYADDPAVIAMELFNEPNHSDTTQTTLYIDTLTRAAREAGWSKPVFYNISEGYWDAHARAVCSARIEGISMQWYPTGLVRNRTLGGNPLPNVDRYTTPFDTFGECDDKARMVYEFDAADVAGSFMYPVMTRSFRGAGIQFATQFAYDPLAMAFANTEYQTHFVNLVYAPSKALGLMIAGEVFRRVPRRTEYPAYPAGARFETGDTVFRVSYEEDLSEMVSATRFLYSNTTTTPILDASHLEQVAGVGSSPVVEYAGTGAYFLDRLDDGVWRLEVYPDAVWVEDPFARGSLERHAIELMWEDRSMRVRLPDLGSSFSVEPLNAGNTWRSRADEGRFWIRPGVYLLARPDAAAPMEADAEFHAPPPSASSVRLLHTPPAEVAAGSTFDISATVSADRPPDSVRVFAPRPGPFGGSGPVRLTADGSPVWRGRVTAPRDGLLEYRIVVYTAGRSVTFPGATPGQPFAWNFTGTETYVVPVVTASTPIVVFDGTRDRNALLLPSRWRSVNFRTGTTAGTVAGELAIRAEILDFDAAPHHFALRSHLPPRLSDRLGDMGDAATVRLLARSGGRDTDVVEFALVLRDGTAWGAMVPLTSEWQTVDIPVSSLKRVDLILLPRPYPHFLPYRFESSSGRERPDLSMLDGVQFAIGRDQLPGTERAGTHGFEIARVLLMPSQSPRP